LRPSGWVLGWIFWPLERQGTVTIHSFTFTLCNRRRPFGPSAQGRRGAGSPARVRGRGGQLERSTGSATTLGSLSYCRGIFPPSTCRARTMHPCPERKSPMLHEVRAVPTEWEGAKIQAPFEILLNVVADPIPPAALAGLPETNAHQCAPHSLRLLLRRLRLPSSLPTVPVL
jgi:hypothetical protein